MQVLITCVMELPDDYMDRVKSFQQTKTGNVLTDDDVWTLIREGTDELFQEEIASEKDGIFVTDVMVTPL